MRHLIASLAAAGLLLACGGPADGLDGGSGGGTGGGTGGGAGGGTGGGSGGSAGGGNKLPTGEVCGTVGPALVLDGGSPYYDGGVVRDGGQFDYNSNPKDSTFDGYTDEPGMRLRGNCPPGVINNLTTAWGTGVYSEDSSICSAAVHAGVVNLATGGAVTIEMWPDPGNYLGSSRNCVTTYDYGSYSGAYVFIR